MDGVNIIYLLLERYDDEILSDDETSWYHVDGSEIRIDPFNADAADEPGGDDAFNIGFRVGKDTHNGIEGPLPTYEAKWMVDDTVFPTRAVLEIAFTLPGGVSLVEDYALGFHVYFSDTDNDDDSPGSKNACLQLWPQLYDVQLGERLGVDATWGNIHSWGDLVCVDMPTVHTVSGGGSGVIQAAIDAAEAGDIIKVGPGEYFENIVIDKPRIRLIGTITEIDSSIVRPAIVAEAVLTIADEDAAPGVVIKDLVFDGKWDDAGTPARAGQGLMIGSAEAKILHNVITWFDNPFSTIGGDPALHCYNVVIEGNTFYRNGGGILFDRPNTVFRYNKVIETGPGGYGLRSLNLAADNHIDIAFNHITNVRQCGIGYGGTAGEGDPAVYTVHHNLVFRSFEERTTPTREMDDGIENQEGTASIDYLYNNTVIGWDSDGFQMNGPSSFFARNNIVVYADGYAYDVRNTPTVLDIDYSICYENGKGSYNTDFAANFGANILEVDPTFEDELEDNYALAAGSPAIDTGELEPFGLKVYYVGDKPDIGAIEYGSPATGVKDNYKSTVASGFQLFQNYPNPFNPTTTICFDLVKAGRVTLCYALFI